jgi:hypothetical protein
MSFIRFTDVRRFGNVFGSYNLVVESDYDQITVRSKPEAGKYLASKLKSEVGVG